MFLLGCLMITFARIGDHNFIPASCDYLGNNLPPTYRHSNTETQTITNIIPRILYRSYSMVYPEALFCQSPKAPRLCCQRELWAIITLPNEALDVAAERGDVDAAEAETGLGV